MSPKILNLLLVVASGSLYYLLISPLYTGIGTIYQPGMGVAPLRDLNESYDTTIAQAQKLVDQSQNLSRQYRALSPEAKETLAVMVPDQIDEVRLVSEVNSIANQTGFALENIAYNQNPGSGGKTGVSSYTVTVSTKGTYEKLKELLHNFETSKRIYAVRSVSVTPPADATGLFDFQLKLETYYMNIK